MRYSRPVRLILGIIILIAFGWIAARWLSNSVMSNDVGKTPSEPAPSEMAMTVTPEHPEISGMLVFE